MPRLFTGLEIPPELASELAELRGGLYGGRWIDAENYHITLRFIGDVGHAVASEIHDELALLARKPVRVTLESLSCFGGEKPRAIVVRVQPSRELLDMQAEQERVIRRVGLPPEPRKFVPHITLARLRGVSQMAVADYLEARGLFASRTFEATRFVLYSSRDSVGGGPYVVEAAYPLNAVRLQDQPLSQY